MKTLFYLLLLNLGIRGCNQNPTPVWAPEVPEAKTSEYYYFPDVEMYYHVPSARFIYFHHNKWHYASSVPKIYVGFHLPTAHKVVLNFHGHHPYHHHHKFKVMHPAKHGVKIKANPSGIKIQSGPNKIQVKNHPAGKKSGKAVLGAKTKPGNKNKGKK